MQSFTNLILFCPWEWNIFLQNMGSDQGQRKKWATNGCRHCVTRVCMYQWTLFLPLPTRCSWLRVTCQVIKRAFRGGWRGKSTPHCSMQHLERPSLTTHTRQHQQLMDSSYLSLWWHEISFACPLNIYYISANQRTSHKSSIAPIEREDMESVRGTIGQWYYINCHHDTWFHLILF